jgi:hypothetical protein
MRVWYEGVDMRENPVIRYSDIVIQTLVIRTVLECDIVILILVKRTDGCRGKLQNQTV